MAVGRIGTYGSEVKGNINRFTWARLNQIDFSVPVALAIPTPDKIVHFSGHGAGDEGLVLVSV